MQSSLNTQYIHSLSCIFVKNHATKVDLLWQGLHGRGCSSLLPQPNITSILFKCIFGLDTDQPVRKYNNLSDFEKCQIVMTRQLGQTCEALQSLVPTKYGTGKDKQ